MANKGIFLRLSPEIESKLEELIEHYTNEVAKADKSAVVSKSIEEMHSFLDILQEQKPKPIFKGFYLEPDIVKVVEKIAERSGKRGSKGVQSKLVNEALRKFFIDEGLMKEEPK